MTDRQTDLASLTATLARLDEELAQAKAERDEALTRRDELHRRLREAGVTGPLDGGLAGRLDRLDPEKKQLLKELRELERALERVRARIRGLPERRDLVKEQLALLDGRAINKPQALVQAADRRYPFVLLPVRVETRFAEGEGDGGLVLKVRIFPDDVHVQAHDEELDAEEAELGAAFASAMSIETEGTPDEEGAMRDLLARAPVARGAWIGRRALGIAPPVPDRAPGAMAWVELLPTRWVITVRSGKTVVSSTLSGPVTEEARQLILEPADGLDDLAPRWVGDFDHALAVGMAVEVPLDPSDAVKARKQGIDVIVVGVDSDTGPGTGSDRLQTALNGHMFGSGLRLLPPGTPTNNSGQGRAQAGGSEAEAFRDLLRPPAYPSGAATDAALLERALGLRPGALAAISRPAGSAFLTGDANAKAMATALWAVAQGYAGRELSSVPPPYGHFTRFVRPGGSLPTLAIGSMPYGLIVCGVIDRVSEQDLGKQVFEQTPFAHAGAWETAVAATPHLPDHVSSPEDFLEMIQLCPSSRSFRMRLVREAGRYVPYSDIEPHLGLAAKAYFRPYSWLPGLELEQRSYEWRRGLVVGSGQDPATHEDYIGAIADSLAAVTGSDLSEPVTTFPPPAVSSKALLYHLLRYSAVLTARWAGFLAAPLPEKSPFVMALTDAFELQPGQIAANDLGALYKQIEMSAGLTVSGNAGVATTDADEQPEESPGGSDVAGGGRVGSISIGTADLTLLPELAGPADGLAVGPAAPGGGVVGPSTPAPDDAGTFPTAGDLDMGGVLSRPLNAPVANPPAPLPPPVDSVEVPSVERAAELLDALRQLSALQESELERLMTETLDATAYRRDSWLSSVHLRRLQLLRENEPEGSYIGAYGFVLGLKPERDPIPADGPGEHRDDPTTTGGFLVAPSLDQAATAAVIRNAYLTHATEDTPDLLRLNLDSGRVRIGKELLDAVRNGNPPADVIGARFERLLHARSQALIATGDDAAGLERHVLSLRRLFPQRADDRSSDERDFRVVNGMGLVEAWRERDSDPPPDGSARLTAFMDGLPLLEAKELAELLDVLEGQVDAATDLLTFEATFRTVRGDRAAATRALDAHSGMALPPELIGIQTPASGVGLSHRIVALFPESGAPGWRGRDNLRAVLAPELNNWAEQALGDPSRVKWGHEVGGVVTTHDLTDTSLSALDLVWLAERWARGSSTLDPDDPALGELTQHLRVAVGADAGEANFRLLLSSEALGDRVGEADLTLDQIGELCLRLARTVRASRPLEAEDLVPAGSAAESVDDLASVTSRARAASTIASAAADHLAGVATALEEVTSADEIAAADAQKFVDHVVAANLAGATVDPIDPRMLRDSGRRADHIASIRSNVSRLRQAASEAISSAADATAEPSVGRARLRDAVTALTSRDFPLIVPFALAPAQVAQLVDSSAALESTVGLSARRSWLQQIARVVPAVSELELARMLGEVLETTPPATVEVSQLPWVPGEAWIGGPLDVDDDAPVNATTSVVSVGPGVLTDSGVYSGLMVGVVNDRIPDSRHTGGVAFPYDQPSARPPQAIAIAVSPETTVEDDEAMAWRWEDLIGAVYSLLDETRYRAADPHYLQGLGLSLPSTMVPYNPSSVHFGTDLVGLAKAELSR